MNLDWSLFTDKIFYIKLIAGIGVAILLAGFRWYVRQLPPEERKWQRGSIRPSRIAILLTAGVCLGIGSAMVHNWHTPNQNAGVLIVGLLVAAYGFVALAGLHDHFVITWDGESLTGPAWRFGFAGFGPRRTIRFEDIMKVSPNLERFPYVSDNHVKIAWSSRYAGHTALLEAFDRYWLGRIHEVLSGIEAAEEGEDTPGEDDDHDETS